MGKWLSILDIRCKIIFMRFLIAWCWWSYGVSSLGFFLESSGTLVLFCSIFNTSPLFQSHLVVFCLELKGISNGSKWLWREGDALFHWWNSANLFWKSRTFLMQLWCRHILAGSFYFWKNICNVEFYNLTYVRNGQIKVFYGSVLLICWEYVRIAEFYNLS